MKSNKQRRLVNFGSHHILPPNMSQKEFLRLKKHWDRKLEQSGVYNIEDFDEQDGTTSPFLYADPNGNEISGSYITIGNRFSEHQAEYYRLASIFNENADFKTLFGHRGWIYKTYKFIFNMHAQGKSYRAILKAYNKMRRRARNKERSIFWLHTHMIVIVEKMFEWHKTDKEGAYWVSGTELPDWVEVYLEGIRPRPR